MTSISKRERRTNLTESEVVEVGLKLAQQEGIGPAIDYLFEVGVAANTAYRVFADPSFHRHLKDRRKIKR